MINNLLCIRQRKSEFFFYYAKYIQLFVSLRNNFRLSLKHTFFNFLNLFTLTNSPNLNFHAFSFEERENALNCTAAATEQNPRLSDIHLDLGLNAIFPSPSAPFFPDFSGTVALLAQEGRSLSRLADLHDNGQSRAASLISPCSRKDRPLTRCISAAILAYNYRLPEVPGSLSMRTRAPVDV